MAELHDSDHFEHEIAANLVDNPLKEGLVVVQVEAQVELWLKDVPNRVVFSCLGWRTQLHLCPQPVVKTVRILPVLAQCVHFKIAGLRAALCAAEELVFLSRVVDAVFVGELDQVVGVSTCSEMSMVDRWLWHYFETIEEWAIDQTLQLVVILAYIERMVIAYHRLAHRIQPDIHDCLAVLEVDIRCMV